MSSTNQAMLNLGKYVHFAAFQRALSVATFVYRQKVFAVTWKSTTHVYALSRKVIFSKRLTPLWLKAIRLHRNWLCYTYQVSTCTL